MRPSRPRSLRFAQPSLHVSLKKSGSGVFSFWSRWFYCDKIIADLAVAFVLVVSSSHLPAAPVLGRQTLRLAAVAVAAAVEPARPAFFLLGRALHPVIRHPAGA